MIKVKFYFKGNEYDTCTAKTFDVLAVPRVGESIYFLYYHGRKAKKNEREFSGTVIKVDHFVSLQTIEVFVEVTDDELDIIDKKKLLGEIATE